MLDGKKYQLIGNKIKDLAFESNKINIEKEGFSRLIKQGPTLFKSLEDAKESQQEGVDLSPAILKMRSIEIELHNILKDL